jgi:hypothetical protein
MMKPGHVFTIEPMINEGSYHDMTWPDQWTSTTQDGKRSAQFEHTLLITETGVEVLTSRVGVADRTRMPAWGDVDLARPLLVSTSGAAGTVAGAGFEHVSTSGGPAAAVAAVSGIAGTIAPNSTAIGIVVGQTTNAGGASTTDVELDWVYGISTLYLIYCAV